MTSLNQQERHLIIIEGFDYFANGLAWIFVSIYLFAHSDIRTTILFQLWSFISLLVFIVLAGWMLKKMSAGFMMKLGVATGAFFYLLLFYLQARSITYLIPLAIFGGFSGGMFWASFNFSQYVHTNEDTRAHYFGYANAVNNFLSAIAPFLGGLIITIFGTTVYYGVSPGYAILFLFVGLLYFVMLLFIGKLPSHETPEFSYRHLFTKTRSHAWHLVLWQHALLGLYDTALSAVMGILFYLIIRQEFWIGAAQSAIGLLGAAGGIVSAKLLGKHPQYFWVGTLGLAGAIIVFAMMQNMVGLWIYVVASGFTGPFLSASLSTVAFHAMDAIKDHWRDKYHFLMERDIVLGILRIVSFLFLYLYLAHGEQIDLAKKWLYILPILPLGIGVLLHMSSKLNTKNLPEGDTTHGI